MSIQLSKTVMTAMRGLREKHRAVLALRVFEQLRYSEIAVVMQCSELGARMLFIRARSALRKRLSDHGISKTLMIMCLGLFGKLTAPSEAASRPEDAPIQEGWPCGCRSGVPAAMPPILAIGPDTALLQGGVTARMTA